MNTLTPPERPKPEYRIHAVRNAPFSSTNDDEDLFEREPDEGFAEHLRLILQQLSNPYDPPTLVH